MRSASAILLLATGGLAGCVTTQQVNGRYELRAQRILEGRKPLVVRTPNPDVTVSRVSVVRHRGTAVVVELSNRSRQPLADLPITVGVGRRPLNHRKGLDYFQTHVASVAPGASVRWVFAARRVPRGRPYAVVGVAGERPPAGLPRLASAPAGRGARTLRVRVRNPSDIPQYGLPVYAVARRGARLVAAGQATVDELDAGASRTVELPLTGDAVRASVSLQALPTIFK